MVFILFLQKRKNLENGRKSAENLQKDDLPSDLPKNLLQSLPRSKLKQIPRGNRQQWHGQAIWPRQSRITGQITRRDIEDWLTEKRFAQWFAQETGQIAGQITLTAENYSRAGKWTANRNPNFQKSKSNPITSSTYPRATKELLIQGNPIAIKFNIKRGVQHQIKEGFQNPRWIKFCNYKRRASKPAILSSDQQLNSPETLQHLPFSFPFIFLCI